MRFTFYKKYTTILLASLVLVGISLFLPKTMIGAIFGILSILLYITTHAYTLSNTLFFNKLPGKVFFATLTLLGLFTTLQSGVYFIYKISTSTILAILLVITLTIIRTQKEQPTKHKHKTTPLEPGECILLIILIALQSVILWHIVSKTTTNVLQTPWLVFGKKFFLIYGITTLLLFHFIWKTKHTFLGLLSVVIHFFITYTLLPIIYPIGFGYDPFLHRATEMHILQHGFASPKTPFYLGQYSIITLLAKTIHLPIHLIDQWLVPILSTFLLPISTYMSMRHGFNMSKKYANIGILLLLIFPMTTMGITTPQNLANLFLLLTIFTTTLCKKYTQAYIPATLLATTAAVTQPISGFFACALVLITYTKQKKYISKKIIWLIFFLSAISIPTLFLCYFFLQNIPIPSLSSIQGNIDSFFGLFKEPYYVKKNIALPFVLEYIYTYKKLIPYTVIILSLATIKKYKELEPKTSIIFLFVIMVNMFFMSTWLILPDLYHFEQVHYAQRLQHIALFFLLPFFIGGAIMVIKKSFIKKTPPTLIWAILAVCVTTSWYLTYPQKNKKVQYPGFNVTSSDIQATKFIEKKQGKNKSYIVLSSSITAAAAIHQYGFKTYHLISEKPHFYYAIPSGGPLAITYRKILYEGQKRSDIDSIMKKTNVDRTYVTISDYWYNSNEINTGLQRIANGFVPINNGAVMVYWFNKKPE